MCFLLTFSTFIFIPLIFCSHCLTLFYSYLFSLSNFYAPLRTRVFMEAFTQSLYFFLQFLCTFKINAGYKRTTWMEKEEKRHTISVKVATIHSLQRESPLGIHPSNCYIFCDFLSHIFTASLHRTSFRLSSSIKTGYAKRQLFDTFHQFLGSEHRCST